MARLPIPKAEYLRQLFHYDPATGELVWRRRTPGMFSAGDFDQATKCRLWNGKFAGKVAGYVKGEPGHQYIRVRITAPDWQGNFSAHRIIWTMMTGKPPAHDVDHRDGDGTNNRWGNLREANHTQNMRNVRRRTGGTSQFKGVTFAKREGKWQAYIKVDGRRKGLGCYRDEYLAARAYDAAATQYFGEFARLNFPAS